MISYLLWLKHFWFSESTSELIKSNPFCHQSLPLAKGFIISTYTDRRLYTSNGDNKPSKSNKTTIPKQSSQIKVGGPSSPPPGLGLG